MRFQSVRYDARSLVAGVVFAAFTFVSGAARGRGRRHYDEPASTAAVVPPAADEVCFSPDEPCGSKLRAFVAAAKTSLDIAVYDVTLAPFAETLVRAAKHCTVRVVVDQRQAAGAHSLVQALRDAGVAIRFGRQRGIMHNKFTIRDDRIVETGSFNYTTHAAAANSENQVYLATPTVVARYRERFARLWREATPPTAF